MRWSPWQRFCIRSYLVEIPNNMSVFILIYGFLILVILTMLCYTLRLKDFCNYEVTDKIYRMEEIHGASRAVSYQKFLHSSAY